MIPSPPALSLLGADVFHELIEVRTAIHKKRIRPVVRFIISLASISSEDVSKISASDRIFPASSVTVSMVGIRGNRVILRQIASNCPLIQGLGLTGYNGLRSRVSDP